jgi:uncharacterized membrane protein
MALSWPSSDDFATIARDIGSLLLMQTVMMLVTAGFALVFREVYVALAFVLAATATGIVGGAARAGIRVTVNGVEMTTKASYLGEATVPVGVFGGDADELEFAVEVVFPELPLHPSVETRTVRVT